MKAFAVRGLLERQSYIDNNIVRRAGLTKASHSLMMILDIDAVIMELPMLLQL